MYVVAIQLKNFALQNVLLFEMNSHTLHSFNMCFAYLVCSIYVCVCKIYSSTVEICSFPYWAFYMENTVFSIPVGRQANTLYVICRQNWNCSVHMLHALLLMICHCIKTNWGTLSNEDQKKNRESIGWLRFFCTYLRKIIVHQVDGEWALTSWMRWTMKKMNAKWLVHI